MTMADLVRPVQKPFELLFDALADPRRGERTMALLLLGYAGAWTVYAVVARGGRDIHFDIGDLVARSREVALGTPRHPPLSGWLLRGWFAVMPAEPWAYYLLAVTLAALGLWIAWRIGAHYLSAEKRVAGAALLTLVPFYNFQVLDFHSSTMLIPLSAATTWWFLRSLETRRAGWAIMAGIGAAAALLAKYWPVFLLAGLGLAALSDRRRGRYFRSPAPWLTVAVGAVVLAPHIAWVATHSLEPFSYAIGAAPATYSAAAGYAIGFIGGIVGFIAAPIVLALIAARPSLAAIGDTLWPSEPIRRTVAIAFAAPLLIAALAAIIVKARIGASWTMSGMTLLPIVLLSSPLLTVTRRAAVGLLALAVVYPLLMAAASPGIAIAIRRHTVPDYASHYRLIAEAVGAAWHARTDQPLRIVGGYTDMANGIDFYFENTPAILDIVTPSRTPDVDDERVKRQGIAIVCPAPETPCVQAMHGYAARYAKAEIADVALARRHFGALDTPVHYLILTIPPQP
jgi:4-amino-4-deoxy-L-arabinose transferase-like glycosyltransferase